jgi:hypothetical protein
MISASGSKMEISIMGLSVTYRFAVRVWPFSGGVLTKARRAYRALVSDAWIPQDFPFVF